MTDTEKNKKMSNDEFLKEFDVPVNSALLRHNLIQTTSNPTYDANRRNLNKCANENVNPYSAGNSKQIIANNTTSSSSTSSNSSSSGVITN